MNDDSLRMQKYEDICKMKRMLLWQGRFCSELAVFRALVRKPFPRFYITPEYCAKMFRWMDTGDARIGRMKPSKRRMLGHLHARYLAMKAENPGMTKIEICYVIVHEQAPELYMSHYSAYDFYLLMKKRKRLLDELKNTRKDT